MAIGLGSRVRRGGRRRAWADDTGVVVGSTNDRGSWVVSPDVATSWRETWVDPIEIDATPIRERGLAAAEKVRQEADPTGDADTYIWVANKVSDEWEIVVRQARDALRDALSAVRTGHSEYATIAAAYRACTEALDG